MKSLQHDEAVARAALLQLHEYALELDLDQGEERFGSRTRIGFRSGTGSTFVEVDPVALHAVALDGRPLDPETWVGGRLPLRLEEGEHELVVEATMRFRHDGEGLHRSVDPADGLHYVYGMSFMNAAPSIFACFDQPDLKAPYSLTVRTPTDWVAVANGPGSEVAPGVWEFDRTPPLSTYFVTLVAGPYHVLRESHDGIGLGLSARRSLAGALETEADELFTLTRQCFDAFHDRFGIRYPFGDYHQAFVPEFNAGAMENPGCVTFRDRMIFSSKVTRPERLQRATTIAHEMAHQWFGDLVTPRWWDDLWLNESFAEYLGTRVTAEATDYTDAWTHHSYSRRRWGLAADQGPNTHPVAGNGSPDALTALQNFDGISYAKGAALLGQLAHEMGDEAFFAGAIDHFTRHRFGNATMADLLGSWERAGAGARVDLDRFVAAWLGTSGVDLARVAPDRSRIELVGASGDVTVDVTREHPIDLAVHRDGEWQERAVRLGSDGIAVAESEGGTDADGGAEAGSPMLIDPYEKSWLLTWVDPQTVRALPGLVAAMPDRLRAGMWNALRSTFHDAEADPDDLVEIACACLPSEDNEDAFTSAYAWLIAQVIPLAGDPEAARARMHRAAYDRYAALPAGSSLALAAFQAAADTAPAELLQSWRHGDLPAGITAEEDLRWRFLTRLAALGAVDADTLDRELAAEPTARARVEHARARAALPTAEAKAWAWRRCTDPDLPNYELEATGRGLWTHGQQELTDPYVADYLAALPRLPEAHAGWVLATATAAFFPHTAARPAVADRIREVLESESLDPTVTRVVREQLDRLERTIRVRQRYGR